MEYLLKVSTVIAIFYISYKLFLQRDTFFEQNRWFLLLGLITSFLVPFLVIPVYIEYTPVAIPIIYGETPIAVENTETPFTILNYLYIIYALGVTGFLIRFLIQLTSLGFVILKNKREKQGYYTFIKTTKNISPFSFFNWIVYNPNNFTKTELEQIITHEKVHARQYHSIDNLLTQLTCIALWFNPFIWFYNKDLKQNLEFIADQETQRKSDCKKSYQTTLLKTSIPHHQMALSNPFYNSLIKKRIVMLHKSKSKKINQLKYVLVIPMLIFFLMSFNTEDVYVENHISNTSNKQKPYKVIITKDHTDADFKRIIKEADKEGIQLKFNNIKRNSDGEIIKISAEFKNDAGGSGTYNLNSTSAINSFSYKQSNEGFGFFTEWETNFIVEKPMNTIKAVKSINGKKPLYILDGEEISEEILTKLNSENIISISVLKGKKATDAFGEKGKNGVVLITEKGISSDIRVVGYGKTQDSILKINQDSILKIRTDDNIEIDMRLDPLIIVDGKETTNKVLANISSNNSIESITIIKNEEAIKKYGVKGKNGVIEVITKKK